jgi:hypothetical protein
MDFLLSLPHFGSAMPDGVYVRGVGCSPGRVVVLTPGRDAQPDSDSDMHIPIPCLRAFDVGTGEEVARGAHEYGDEPGKVRVPETMCMAGESVVLLDMDPTQFHVFDRSLAWQHSWKPGNEVTERQLLCAALVADTQTLYVGLPNLQVLRYEISSGRFLGSFPLDSNTSTLVPGSQMPMTVSLDGPNSDTESDADADSESEGPSERLGLALTDSGLYALHTCDGGNGFQLVHRTLLSSKLDHLLNSTSPSASATITCTADPDSDTDASQVLARFPKGSDSREISSDDPILFASPDSDRMYISDSDNDRIVVLSMKGEWLQCLPSSQLQVPSTRLTRDFLCRANRSESKSNSIRLELPSHITHIDYFEIYFIYFYIHLYTLKLFLYECVQRGFAGGSGGRSAECQIVQTHGAATEN